MIKSQDIIRLLKDKSTDLSREEIEKIMEDELTKSESEMDADLIEICLDALSEKASEEKVKPKKYFSLKVASFVAAAAVLVFVITSVIPRLTDSSNHVTGTTKASTEATTEHVSKETGSVTTPSTKKADESDNLPTESKPSPLLKEEVTTSLKTKGDITLPPEESIEQQARKFLAENNFENLLLPKAIFENGTIMKTCFDKSTAEIEISTKGKIYNITIEKSTEDIEEKNFIDVNGLSVLVESENNSSEITYRKDNLNYRIVFHSDYEEAVRIAKTIC